MEAARELPQDDHDLRRMMRAAREERGLLPQQVAAAAGTSVDDVEFVEAHGVAVTASMLNVLDYMGIDDYQSRQLSKLAQMIPGNSGERILTELVRGGYKEIETIEAAAEDSQLLALPWFDLGQLSLLRQGLELYHHAEAIDDSDES